MKYAHNCTSPKVKRGKLIMIHFGISSDEIYKAELIKFYAVSRHFIFWLIPSAERVSE
jgi:hypothetical protein